MTAAAIIVCFLVAAPDLGIEVGVGARMFLVTLASFAFVQDTAAHLRDMRR